MQTMSSKTRTSLVIGGVAVLVLALAVALFALTQRSQNQTGGTDALEQLAEPENGTPLNTEAATNTQTTTGSAPNTATTADTQGAGETRDVAGESTTDGSGATLDGDETAPAMTTFEAVPAVHIVQPNETLYEISQKYYNTHIYAGDIEALNGLEDPNKIYAGMELKLPQPSELPGYSR